MCRLLLDSDSNVTGMGITLPPEEQGNTYVDELSHNDRFIVKEWDILTLAKKCNSRLDFAKLMDLTHANFSGFDLVCLFFALCVLCLCVLSFFFAWGCFFLE